MASQKKQAGSDEDPGAPEWMVTFSDCMTLLLTFFVLLLSFSSFDNRIFRSLKVVYSKALTSITPMRLTERDAVLYLPPVRHIVELADGSEKPTSDDKLREGLMKENRTVNPNTGVAFLIPSNKVFWAKGSALSSEGRRVMEIMASYLKESPSRIVISERGPANNRASVYFGLPRAWAIMEYLTKEQNLNSNRFSISAEGILAQKSLNTSRLGSKQSGAERILEIVLLQRSIYN